MKKNNIVLIGMPGCGKSTLGIVVAKMLCMDFLDVDLVIQKKIGTSLQEYIDKYGVEKFLEVEADVVCGIDCENTVISTGGSAPLTRRGAAYLSELGRVVYINLPCEEIEQRIKNLVTRGVAMKRGETLRDVYEYRAPIYESCADIVVDIDSNDLASNCRMLAEMLK